ncbi:MAG: hypothetical protein ACP6IY_19590 [Promethearchaeia archaeon]
MNLYYLSVLRLFDLTYSLQKSRNIYYTINPDGLCPECEKEKEFEDDHLPISQIIPITSPPIPDEKSLKKQTEKAQTKPKRISISNILKKQTPKPKKQRKGGSMIDTVDIILCIILVILILLLIFLMPKFSF